MRAQNRTVGDPQLVWAPKALTKYESAMTFLPMPQDHGDTTASSFK